MYYFGFDRPKLRLVVDDELRRDSAHRKGRKRDSGKIFLILSVVAQNELDGAPLSSKEIIEKLPQYNANDIEEHLQFLANFPKDGSFLKRTYVYRVDRGGKRPRGGPHYIYKLNEKYKYLVNEGRAGVQLDAILS